MTYTRTQNGYSLTTPYGTFEAGTKEAVRLAALMAENDARVKAEQAEERRQMMLEEQRMVLEFNESRRAGR